MLRLEDVRPFPALVLVLLLPVLVEASDDGTGRGTRRAEAAEAAAAALGSDETAVAAHGAYEAGRLQLIELERGLVERLRLETAPPRAERCWALVQILLDALFRIGATPPSDLLLPHFRDHQDTIVAILVRGRDAYPAELLSLYKKLTHHRGYLAWRAVGHALADAHGRRFLPLLLPDVEVRHVIVVRRPPPIYRGKRNPSTGPRPPPRIDIWTERHGVPEGFPPVPVLLFTDRRGSRLLSLISGERMERTEHPGPQVVLERRASEARRPGPAGLYLRWLDTVLVRAGARPRRGLSAYREIHHRYTGPSGVREILRAHREALLEAWWDRVQGLLRVGLIDRATAVALAQSVDLRLRDVRQGRHRSLYPLPEIRSQNPFRPRPRPHIAAM